MNYEIVEMQPFSGSEAKVYSLISKGENKTLFEKFVDENDDKFKNEIKDILKRLYQIGHTTGARISFFKEHEGRFGDFVCALFDTPKRNLRLYCIRFGTVAIILGGGGHKKKGTKAWQEDEKLSFEANQVIDYANDILKRIDEGDLQWSFDKTELEGNLKNYDDGEK
ncbi:MAG: hypothetical protein KKA07_00080 [Bacteroidetes bacterium]|nr:hypothetical protein [Bacteroidota bacterium]MBU1717447.1 hypothetical protein [Bacteroidota bacterium]